MNDVDLMNNISPIDFIGSNCPILLIPSNDTHVEWMLPLARKLNNVNYMILPERREGASEKLQANEISPISYKEGILRHLSPSVVVLANDWGPEEYEIVQEAKLLGIPTVCIQEGSVFFPIHTVRVLRNADYIFVSGLKTPKLLNRRNICLTGNPKYDLLTPSPLPEKPIVIINCNFTYGIFENIRMQWLGDVIYVCKHLGLEFFISQHPRDKAELPPDLPVIKSSQVHYIDQLKRATLLVSRFSTLIYEAMLLGREAIYYDPHGENPDIFDDVSEGMYRAKSPSELEAVLLQALESVGRERPSRQKFLEDYCGPIDHQATERCAKVITDISRKNPYQQKKYFKMITNAEEAIQSGDWSKAISFYNEAIQVTPAEPKLLVARGNMHLLQNEILPAIRDFCLASHIHPEYIPAKICLAYSYLLIGRLEKTLQQLKPLERLTVVPEELELLYQLIENPPRFIDWEADSIWKQSIIETALKETPRFEDEIKFWWRELTLVGEHSGDILDRLITECQHKVFPASLLPYLEESWERRKQKPRVLDVGSGPLSMLGWGVKNDIIELIAVDPLAEVYLDFLKELSYQIDYPLVKAYGEELETVFADDSFDLIWIRNALDHCENPSEVMRQSTNILCSGGYLFLSGFVREASFEGGQGLHKYDFYIDDDLKVVYERWTPTQSKEKVSLTDTLPLKLIECSQPSQRSRDWMYAIWQKE